MTEAQFNRLTQHCDRILRRFSTETTVVALPWLHLLNAHPNSTAQYAFAFKKRSWISVAGWYAYHLAYILAKLLTSVFVGGKIEGRDADVIFISHFVDRKKRSGDFYYGDLPFFLQNRSVRTIIGMIDHTPGKKTAEEVESALQDAVPRLLFPKTLSFRKEWTIACKSFRAHRLLRNIETGDAEEKNIAMEASRHALAPATLAAFRIEAIVSELLQQANPRALVITWEGRSWERLAVYAAQRLGIKSIAYQHTVLLASSHALLQSLGAAYDPDVVLTIGDRAATLFGSVGFHHTEIKSFGSYRMALSEGTNVIKNDEQLYCLVAPEGIESEAVWLFDYAIAVAREHKDIRFVFRMHPVLPFSQLANLHPRFAALPGNCSVSQKENINDDFDRCQFLLYRGSSVALYAVMRGVKPFYYSTAGEMSIDPLYFLNEWKQVVHNEADFTNGVRLYQQSNPTERTMQSQQAQDECRSYVKTPDNNAFLTYLNNPSN